ncbi:MAG: ATP-dependent helicase [Gammaproteobacteria bacterium]|nr:ATP-dependent helicase [Gammaproteobacteria bacterium]
MSSNKIELNQQQSEATSFGRMTENGFISNPLLIIAGAGTGKTNTLAHRAAHLIINGVQPERILLMTFSRRAAKELCDRAKLIVARELKSKNSKSTAISFTWMGTFHSIANRLLRIHAEQIGLDPSFSIIDRSDSADMMDLSRHQLELSAQKKRFPNKNTCLNIYSSCVNAQKDLGLILKHRFPWCLEWEDELKALFKVYSETKLKQISLDYDDLLLYWYLMVAEPQIAELLRATFDHILVDEYQDTNILQAGILLRLFPDGKGLTVVGDDAQSIYSFRSAEVENILNFPEQFSPHATVISLKKNYRSTQPILDLSNALLKEGLNGYKNRLYSEKPSHKNPLLVTVEDDESQCQYIVEQILKYREEGTPLKRQAVLFRSSHHTDRLELELQRRNIPYRKHGGLKFLEAAHVKDLLSTLRWADNPKHRISGFRVLKMLEGVGPKTATKLLDYLALNNFDFESFKSYKSALTHSPEWVELTRLLSDISNNILPWSEQMEQLKNWYLEIVEENYDNPFVRGGDVEHLTLISQEYPSRERFLSELTLDPPTSTGDLSGEAILDDDYLILSTIHSAKGQEWKNVFIINVADGNFPNEYAAKDPKDIEEERRLLNVAITRAQKNLQLIQPLKYWVPEQQRFGGRHVYGAKSRFLSNNVCECLSEMSYRDENLVSVDSAVAAKAILHIKTQILGMWD